MALNTIIQIYLNQIFSVELNIEKSTLKKSKPATKKSMSIGKLK